MKKSIVTLLLVVIITTVFSSMALASTEYYDYEESIVISTWLPNLGLKGFRVNLHAHEAVDPYYSSSKENAFYREDYVTYEPGCYGYLLPWDVDFLVQFYSGNTYVDSVGDSATFGISDFEVISMILPIGYTCRGGSNSEDFLLDRVSTSHATYCITVIPGSFPNRPTEKRNIYFNF